MFLRQSVPAASMICACIKYEKYMLLAGTLHGPSMNNARRFLIEDPSNVPPSVYRTIGSRRVCFEGCDQRHSERLTLSSQGLSAGITRIGIMECVGWRSVGKARCVALPLLFFVRESICSPHVLQPLILCGEYSFASGIDETDLVEHHSLRYW